MSKENSKIGVLIPGMGAVASTFICGVIACNKGLSKPIGSMTQMGSIRLGKRSEDRSPIVKDFVPVADMENLVFGGWDINDENVYDISIRSEVLEKTLLDQIKPELEKINVFKAVFDKAYVRRLEGNWIKTGSSKMDLANQVMDDIKIFNEKNDVSSNVMIWCGSTEIYFEPSEVHSSIEKFEEGLRNDSPDISPSMIYAYAAIKLGIPFANGAPNLSADIPALIELAESTKKGYKPYVLFLTQIEGINKFKIAKDIDAEYYKNYLKVKKIGVKFLAYRCKLNDKEIKIEKKINIIDE